MSEGFHPILTIIGIIFIALIATAAIIIIFESFAEAENMTEVCNKWIAYNKTHNGLPENMIKEMKSDCGL